MTDQPRLTPEHAQLQQSFRSYLFNLFQRLKRRPVRQTVFYFPSGRGIIFDYHDDLQLEGEKE